WTSAVRAAPPLSNVATRPGIAPRPVGEVVPTPLPAHVAATTTGGGPLTAPVPVPPLPVRPLALGDAVGDVAAAGAAPPPPPAARGAAAVDACPARFPLSAAVAADRRSAPLTL